MECTAAIEETALTFLPAPAPIDRVKALVLDSLNSEHSRAAYGHALGEFLGWCQAGGADGFTKATVQRYAAWLRDSRKLSSASINLRLTAVRRLAAEAADNGLLDLSAAQAIGRVKGVKQAGTRTGNWLTAQQAEQLLQAPDVDTIRGKRDRAILAVMIGCGLRRSEVSEVSFTHIQQREGRWAIVDLKGKGNRVRTVPMPSWAKACIDRWTEAASLTDGHVFRPLNNRRQITGSVLLPQNIMELVTRYGQRIGIPRLAPHDLRRTFAKLAHKGHAALEQIQLSLGHASITTTERYLGVRQSFEDAPCDHLGLKLSA